MNQLTVSQLAFAALLVNNTDSLLARYTYSMRILGDATNHPSTAWGRAEPPALQGLRNMEGKTVHQLSHYTLLYPDL